MVTLSGATKKVGEVVVQDKAGAKAEQYALVQVPSMGSTVAQPITPPQDVTVGEYHSRSRYP